MSLQSLRAKLAVFLPAVAASLILLGCGGGSEPAFSDRPVASFLSGDGLTVNPGETTGAGVQLDKLARTDIWVRLFAIEQNTGSFILPTAVKIPAEQKAAVFPITASNSATGQVTIRIQADPDYDVGTPSAITVSTAVAVDDTDPDSVLPVLASTPSTLLSLVGGDAVVSSGAAFFYNVQRNQCGATATVPLVVTGDVGCFSVPESVTVPAGACTASFSGVAGQCDAGSIDISILPPSGYALDSDIGVIVLGSGLASGETPTDRPLGEGGTVRVTIAN
jgi:hypothetical protein